MAISKAGKSVHSARYRLLLGRLKTARLAGGLTQAQVAARIGQPQSFVSKVESGERRLDVVELERLAEVYGRSLAFFLDQGSGATPSGTDGRSRRARRHSRKRR